MQLEFLIPNHITMKNKHIYLLIIGFMQCSLNALSPVTVETLEGFVTIDSNVSQNQALILTSLTDTEIDASLIDDGFGIGVISIPVDSNEFPPVHVDTIYKPLINISYGLIAHYPFSGDSNDQSGKENHLENRGAILTSDRFGMKNSAYAFDGKTSYLFADIDDRKGDFSLSLWAKANDVEQSRYRSVINIHDNTPGSKDTSQIHTSGGRYPTYQFFSSNPESFALVTQDWQHLAVSVSGKVIRFYENGAKVYSQELEGGEANQFSNIIIGQNRNGDKKYNGHVDDIYVYNRAINDAEVARLFEGGLEDSDGDGLTDAYETGKGRYQAVSGEFTWVEAMQDAKEKGGHIATITSEAEWNAIKEEL